MSNQRQKSKRVRPKVGDIFRIPLPNGHVAYGKVFRDASIGIYEGVYDANAAIPTGSSYAFIVGIYDDILRSGTWPIIGHVPFETEEEEWPPPHFIKDILSDKYSIYYRGEIKKSTVDECKGLEEAAVWDANHIIERIMKRGGGA